MIEKYLIHNQLSTDPKLRTPQLVHRPNICQGPHLLDRQPSSILLSIYYSQIQRAGSPQRVVEGNSRMDSQTQRLKIQSLRSILNLMSLILKNTDRELFLKNKAARANKSERYFFPGLYFTPNSIIYNFWIDRGSFSKIIFCSNVFGYSIPLGPFGLSNFLFMSCLMSQLLMLNLILLVSVRSNLLIIIIQMSINRIFGNFVLLTCLLFISLELQNINILDPWNTHDNSTQITVQKALFVTSWNKQGRKYAIKYAHRFESIIVCMYDLRFQDRKFYLQKLTEIQSSFFKDLRNANEDIKIYLRIYVVSSAKSLFEYVSSSTKKISQVSAGIVKILKKHKADGIYYDSPFNLPLKSSVVQSIGPYDKFAILLNGYLINYISDLLLSSPQRIIYGIQLDEFQIDQIDFSALKTLKYDKIMIEALASSKADIETTKAIKFMREMRSSDDRKFDIYIVIPLFSWRNGIGIKTSLVEESITKNGVSLWGLKNGLCVYGQHQTGSESFVPCKTYYDTLKKYVFDFRIKIAYFEAGDALQQQFDII